MRHPTTTGSLRVASAALALLLAAPVRADAPLVDRDAVFARARAIAAAQLPETAQQRLLPFAIEYRLTLLETGQPDGDFEVDLLIAESRSVVPARNLIAAATDDGEKARLERLLADVESGYFYRTIKLRFPERGERAAEAALSSILLNRDPDPPAASHPESP